MSLLPRIANSSNPDPVARLPGRLPVSQEGSAGSADPKVAGLPAEVLLEEAGAA